MPTNKLTGTEEYGRGEGPRYWCCLLLAIAEVFHYMGTVLDSCFCQPGKKGETANS